MFFLAKIFDPLTTDLVRELRTKIHSMVDIGLGYLSLSRGTNSLSGGEAQRIKIAKFLNSSLSDMVYILDEPSVGLHPHDIDLLKKGLSRLRDKGNTILIVEHNPLMMAFADYAIELGPVAGTNGGQITFQGSFKELSHSESLTGRWLRRRLAFKDKVRKSSKMIELTNLHMHNLKKNSCENSFGSLDRFDWCCRIREELDPSRIEKGFAGTLYRFSSKRHRHKFALNAGHVFRYFRSYPQSFC